MTSLGWDHKDVDAEAAFGARVALPNMSVDRGAILGLRYSTNAEGGQSASSLDVEALPVAPSQAKRMTTVECDKLVAIHFRNRVHEGAKPMTVKDGIACDGWNSDPTQPLDYEFVRVASSGAVVTASGHDANSHQRDQRIAEFRSALVDMQVIRTAGSQ